MTLSVDLKNIKGFVEETELEEILAEIKEADSALRTGSGEGNDFIGWLGLPENIDMDELARVKKSAEKIISDSEVLLVVGIGGSYLGARAVIEFIKSPNYNLKKKLYFSTKNTGLESGLCYILVGDLRLSKPGITQKQNGHTYTHCKGWLGALKYYETTLTLLGDLTAKINSGAQSRHYSKIGMNPCVESKKK